MPDSARIAVIGTGWWSTTAHIPALQANPNADLVALADVRADALEKAARHFGVERTYTDVHEMLARERLDHVLLTGGGITPGDDAAALSELGVGRIFGPGTATTEAIEYIRDWFTGREDPY